MIADLSMEAANVRLLLALAIVLVTARSVGWIMSKLGQPRVNGEILAGILLGPSLLGLIFPQSLDYLFPAEVVRGLDALAQLGLVLFMALVGLDLDLDGVKRQGRKALLISHTSIVVPLTLGSVVGLVLFPRLGASGGRLGFSLFIGTAMAITAFPVLARILNETGLARTEIGALVVACAAVDDVTAWCLLAVVVTIVESSGPGAVVQTVAASALFLVVMTTVVRPLLRRSRSLPAWAAIVIPLVCAWITQEIGIHAIFGAFMAGAVMPRTAGVKIQVRQRLEHLTVELLLPVVFVVVGLSTKITAVDSAYLWAATLLVVAIAVAGKWGGSMVAARLTGEPWRDASTIGILMNTRGLTELVILTVGLELGALSETMFTIMVIMALTTTFMATPLLRLTGAARAGSSGWQTAYTAPVGSGSSEDEVTGE